MESITLVVVKPPTKPHSKQPATTKMEQQHLYNNKVLTPKPTDSEAACTDKDLGNTSPTSNLSRKLLSAGTAACIADAITFPLDTAKVRLQIQGEAVGASQVAGRVYHGIFGTLYTVAKTEGVKGWYSGLTAGLQRQMCFASVRIGLYDSMKQAYMNVFQVSSSNGGWSVFGIRVLAGMTTGGLAVLAAQPTDVVKVRMQAQGISKSRYTNVRHAYSSIARLEGVKGLWKGTLPNVTRNSIVNVTELVSYDLIKENILARKLLADTMPCHVVSAFGAGLVTTIIASPVDVVKTRFMNSSLGTYSGALSCASSMAKKEGMSAFYKGFMPSFMRLGSWNVVMFVTYEQIKRIVFKDHESDKGICVTHYVKKNSNSNNNNSLGRTMLSRSPRHLFRELS